MPKAKKLDLEHFIEPPMLYLGTAQLKLLYTGLRAMSNDEGIGKIEIPYLNLRIFASSKTRTKDLSNALSAMEKAGAIFRYKVGDENYFVLPYHFIHEGTIYNFLPSEYPRPSKEFYLKHPQYCRGLEENSGRVRKILDTSRLVPTFPDTSRHVRTFPYTSRHVRKEGEIQSLGELIPETLKDLNVRYRFKKRLKDVQEKGVIKGKRESLKGEKGKSGEGEKIDLERILAVCGDKKSTGFYRLVLKKCPQEMIVSALTETKAAQMERWKTGGLNKPGAYFTKVIIELAKKQGIRLKK